MGHSRLSCPVEINKLHLVIPRYHNIRTTNVSKHQVIVMQVAQYCLNIVEECWRKLVKFLCLVPRHAIEIFHHNHSEMAICWVVVTSADFSIVKELRSCVHFLQ